MSDADETTVFSPGASRLDGGGGFDILDFGGLQGRTVFGYNAMHESGGGIRFTDPSTGWAATVDFANFEGFRGSPYADDIWGNARTTFIDGGAGDDTLNAQVLDTPYAITIFGGAGSDSIGGSEMGDLMNGNTGDDVVHGWDGDDWLHGGQNSDVVYGDNGDDFANGNLGNDTVDGGGGSDTLLGGKGDDVILGGTGDDVLSGDLGQDTLTGGAGADAFRFLGGDDRITDFNPAEGDRLLVSAGTTYTLSQSGDGVEISFAGGGTIALAGVTLGGLTSGWIVEG